MTKCTIALSAIACVASASLALADAAPQTLPYTNAWTNTGLITTDADWSQVPGCQGFNGSGLTALTGTDPQTLLADGTNTAVSLFANKADATLTSGGLGEFELADPTVALAGSGAASAPFLLVNLNTTAFSMVRVQYDARDIEATADNAVQKVALHYRIGNTGTWTNVPAAYIADATTGPSLATQVTHVDVMLPATCDNQPLLQIRVMTSNAAGNDEWVGIDNISVTGEAATATKPTTWGSLKQLFR